MTPAPRSLRRVLYGVAVAAALLFYPTVPCGGTGSKAAPTASISGAVVDEAGAPVAGATVRLQGKKNHTRTDDSGRFTLSGLPEGEPINVGAWKEGFYCALLKEVKVPEEGARIKLISVQKGDNPAYAWLPPVTPDGKGSCAECHHRALIEMSLQDAHLKSAQNPRFLTMYHGTDMDGNRGSPTRYGLGSAIWKNIHVPLPPEPSDPYFGPGYLLDFPDTPFNCSSCHVPGVSLAGRIDPATAEGADRFGAHCDFCHKVADVRIDPATQLPFPRLHGVKSMTVKRPFTEDPDRPQLFFGSFDDDNVPAEDTKLPLLSESRYCAPCHYGVFWSTVVYDSYGEWLRSPYADPKSGKAKTCRECHMVSPTVWKGTTLTNVAPGKGGIERDPSAIHSHFTTIDETLLQNSLTMTASAKAAEGKALVEVKLYNDKTGHHIPTDCPLRHLILLVEAKDSNGKPLKPSMKTPVLPEWVGVGDPAKGYFAGLPGKAFAKLLIEKWTNVFPATAYWRHTELSSDNRLAAFQTDVSSYAFDMPAGGDARVTVTLLYRRAFKEVMDQKKWDIPDIVMAREELSVKNER